MILPTLQFVLLSFCSSMSQVGYALAIMEKFYTLLTQITMLLNQSTCSQSLLQMYVLTLLLKLLMLLTVVRN